MGTKAAPERERQEMEQTLRNLWNDNGLFELNPGGTIITKDW
jgi:hypothetical protein